MKIQVINDKTYIHFKYPIPICPLLIEFKIQRIMKTKDIIEVEYNFVETFEMYRSEVN